MMTLRRFLKSLCFDFRQRIACRSIISFMLLALIVMGLPALSDAQQTCRPDGDVDQSGSVTAADALLVFQQALGLVQLSACQQIIADVFPMPFDPDANITASDALCIFQKALGLPSCLDILPPNEPPVVNAGPNQFADAGTVVVLSGTASDPDGTITSYLWEQTAGTMVSLSGDTSPTAMFTAPDVLADETLGFRLTVTDDGDAQAFAEVQVMVIRRVEQFVSVSAGLWYTCGLRDTGIVVCRGDDRRGQSTPPAGTFKWVSAGDEHTCGLRDTGVVECWGSDGSGRSTPPAGTFSSVSAGGFHSCGALDTGAVQCWGFDGDGQSTPPAGTFSSVSAGGFHSCGVLDAGAVQCWGDDGDGQSTSPEGTFTSVSAGRWHTCGLRATGVVECWGYDESGQSTPPEGAFTSVSSGAIHTCGLRDTGAVECWGFDVDGRSTPPAGTFTSISAGWVHTCGVLDTGTVECWGRVGF